ncbi:MAG: AraC family transcriptional regulator [Vicinamibacterales bacterium]
MDALSEVLRVVKLDAAIFFNAEFSSPWCFYSPASPQVAPMLSPGASRVVVYHLLTDGEAYIRLEDGPPIALRAGDIVTCPHGDPHYLGHGPEARPIDGHTALPGLLAQGLALVRAGGGGPRAHLICGFLACEPQLCETFLAGLPPIVKINIRDDTSGQWLENSLRFSVAEAATAHAGAEAMLAKLSEVVFVETLRRYVRDLPPERTGWLAGARDPVVGRALTLLHRQPAAPWTIAGLAQEVGTSRSVLAERFRTLLGEPPIAYLTNWRLRLGAQALATTSRSVGEIADEVGYESEASFNRAFKRLFGQPPARYRQAERERRATVR